MAALGVHRRHGRGLPRARRCPVIGGNVSLYNESGGADIDPTPVLGVLGLVDAVRAPPARDRAGRTGTPSCCWTAPARRRAGAGRSRSAGPAGPPSGATTAPGRCRPSTSPRTPRLCAFVAGLGRGAGGRGRGRCRPLVRAVHDVSSGGLGRGPGRDGGAPAASGCVVEAGEAAELFSELPSRFVVGDAATRTTCAPGPPPQGSRPRSLGRAGGDRLRASRGLVDLPVERREPTGGHEGNLASAPGGQLMTPVLCENRRPREGSLRCLRCLRARTQGGQPHLRRPLRPAAPGPGVGRHGGQRRRHHHRGQGHGPGGHRLRRAHPLGAAGPPGHRPHPLLDARRLGLGRRPAGLPAGRPGRVRPRPQRQPDQHPRAGREGRDAARGRSPPTATWWPSCWPSAFPETGDLAGRAPGGAAPSSRAPSPSCS